jgi:hypothetical protein
MTGRVIIQDTPTCRPEIVKEIAGGFVRLGEKATEVLRRLEERPGFPGAQRLRSGPDRESHHQRSGSGSGRQGRALLTQAGRACLSVYIV